jgi:hypothetical protein
MVSMQRTPERVIKLRAQVLRSTQMDFMNHIGNPTASSSVFETSEPAAKLSRAYPLSLSSLLLDPSRKNANVHARLPPHDMHASLSLEIEILVDQAQIVFPKQLRKDQAHLGVRETESLRISASFSCARDTRHELTFFQDSHACPKRTADWPPSRPYSSGLSTARE